jgi:hypothetical protein
LETTSGPIEVPLRSKRQRRAVAVQKLNHAVPAVGLLLVGKQAIAAGGQGLNFFLGVFEIVSAAALIVLTARELRTALRSPHPAHPEHHGVDWVDIAAGLVLTAEVLEHWHVTGHIARPTVLTAIVTFALGFSHGRIHGFAGRRRVLRVDEDGIAISGRPFKVRRLEAAWRDLRSIEIGERWALISTRSGRKRKLDLADLDTEVPARAALIEARRRFLAAPLPTAE